MRLLHRLTMASLLLGLAAYSVGRALPAEDKAVDLKVGDPAPKFTGTDDHGKPWKSSNHVGKKILVVYFYAAALTGG